MVGYDRYTWRRIWDGGTCVITRVRYPAQLHLESVRVLGQEILEFLRHLHLFIGENSYALKVGLYSFEELCIFICERVFGGMPDVLG